MPFTYESVGETNNTKTKMYTHVSWKDYVDDLLYLKMFTLEF
jgi:hypothetical protein